jgi:Fe-S-cluster-containing dehydrogenase component
MSGTSKLSTMDSIIFDSTKCTGCKVCELVCSFFHERVFSPSLTKIHIFNDLFSGINRATINFEECDLCGGEPKCVEWCVTKALSYNEEAGELEDE